MQFSLKTSTKQSTHTYTQRNGPQVFSKIRNLFIREKKKTKQLYVGAVKGSGKNPDRIFPG